MSEGNDMPQSCITLRLTDSSRAEPHHDIGVMMFTGICIPFRNASKTTEIDGQSTVKYGLTPFKVDIQ